MKTKVLSLTGSGGIVVTSDGAASVDVSGATLAQDIKDLQDDVAGRQTAILSLPSAPGSGQFDLFDGFSIKSLSADAPLSIANNGTILELSLDQTNIQRKLAPIAPITLSAAGALGIDSTVFAPATSTY